MTLGLTQPGKCAKPNPGKSIVARGETEGKSRLRSAQSVGLACEYVINEQGIVLPDFDVWLSLKNSPSNAGGNDLLQ